MKMTGIFCQSEGAFSPFILHAFGVRATTRGGDENGKFFQIDAHGIYSYYV